MGTRDPCADCEARVDAQLKDLTAYAQDETTPLEERWYWVAEFLLTWAHVVGNPLELNPVWNCWLARNSVPPGHIRLYLYEHTYAQVPAHYAARAMTGALGYDAGPAVLHHLIADVLMYHRHSKRSQEMIHVPLMKGYLRG